MKLRSARLMRFRNHRETAIACSPRTNVFLGDNGEGKTNILEGISFLCLTKSFFAANDATVLQIGETDFTIEGSVESDGGFVYDLRVCYDSRERRKEYLINRQAPETLASIIGQFPVVILSPENSSVTFGGPGDRRRFLDLVISQASRAYLEDVIEYRRILRQRNRILSDQQGATDRIAAIIDPWDETLMDHGVRIIERRWAFTREFGPVMREAFERIAGSKEIPTLSYESSPNTADGMNEAQIRSRFRAELNKRSTEERRLGTTLVGPHRDELGFQINALDLRGFASQGQHKTFLVALKLAEFAYLKERCHETPILLLDDVLSELDDTRAARLLAEAESAGQTFITSTDGRPFKQQDQYKRFWVSAGIVREYEEARENAAAR